MSERSDRFVDPAEHAVRPIHQEEWSCAFEGDPDEVIQRPGTNGGWADLYRFVTAGSPAPAAERAHFWTALAALVLLGHRDVHRRNVAVRYERRGELHRAELAPLYDVASMDGQADPRWRSLGLPVGGEEEIDRIGEAQWIAMARECGADPEEVLGLVADTARKLPEAVDLAVGEARAQDQWRDPDQARRRLDALRRGTSKRVEKARRPTVHR